MPGPEILTVEMIARFFKAKGLKDGCELCGQELWDVYLPEHDFSPAMTIYHARGGVNSITPDVARLIPCYTVACNNCGNMKQLRVQQLSDWVVQEQTEKGEAP